MDVHAFLWAQDGRVSLGTRSSYVDGLEMEEIQVGVLNIYAPTTALACRLLEIALDLSEMGT